VPKNIAGSRSFFRRKKEKKRQTFWVVVAEMSEPVIGKEDAEFSTQFFKVTHFVF
jgi:hypothetical protein